MNRGIRGALIAVCAIAWGCTSNLPGTCERDSDCGSTEHCTQNICVLQGRDGGLSVSISFGRPANPAVGPDAGLTVAYVRDEDPLPVSVVVNGAIDPVSVSISVDGQDAGTGPIDVGTLPLNGATHVYSVVATAFDKIGNRGESAVLKLPLSRWAWLIQAQTGSQPPLASPNGDVLLASNPIRALFFDGGTDFVQSVPGSLQSMAISPNINSRLWLTFRKNGDPGYSLATTNTYGSVQSVIGTGVPFSLPFFATLEAGQDDGIGATLCDDGGVRAATFTNQLVASDYLEPSGAIENRITFPFADQEKLFFPLTLTSGSQDSYYIGIASASSEHVSAVAGIQIPDHLIAIGNKSEGFGKGIHTGHLIYFSTSDGGSETLGGVDASTISLTMPAASEAIVANTNTGSFQEVRPGRAPEVLDGPPGAGASEGVIVASDHVYTFGRDTLYAIDDTKTPGNPNQFGSIAWQANVSEGGFTFGNQNGIVCGKHGHARLIVALGDKSFQSYVGALVIDDDGLRPTAPWPMDGHDQFNSRNAATPLLKCQ